MRKTETFRASNTRHLAFRKSSLEKNSLQVSEINDGSFDVMNFCGFEDFFDSRLIIHC